MAEPETTDDVADVTGPEDQPEQAPEALVEETGEITGDAVEVAEPEPGAPAEFVTEDAEFVPEDVASYEATPEQFVAQDVAPEDGEFVPDHAAVVPGEVAADQPAADQAWAEQGVAGQEWHEQPAAEVVPESSDTEPVEVEAVEVPAEYHGSHEAGPDIGGFALGRRRRRRDDENAHTGGMPVSELLRQLRGDS